MEWWVASRLLVADRQRSSCNGHTNIIRAARVLRWWWRMGDGIIGKEDRWSHV
ncbi:hypothetical protein U1Q18_017379, partial [Sarracenia purpurea var. burkii]